jgi:hypothetical protein
LRLRASRPLPRTLGRTGTWQQATLLKAMNSIDLGVLSTLEKHASDSQVRELMHQLGLTERYDDPPFRHYMSSRKNGLSFLFEDDRLIDIQIFVQPTKSFAACPYVLPLGVAHGMTQAQVHQALGEPRSSDEMDSRFILNAHDVRLLISYDSLGVVRRLSFAPAQHHPT